MQRDAPYDYAASGNCYRVRLLRALLGRDYERVPVDIFAGKTLTDALGLYSNVSAWRERIESVPGFMNDLAPYPDNAQAGRSRSIYDD